MLQADSSAKHVRIADLFLGRQYEAPPDPRHVYCKYPPPGVCAAPKSMVLSCFSLKTGVDFDSFGMKSGMFFF